MLVQCFVIVTFVPLILTNPTGCSYDASTVLYTCNARSWVLPLVFSSFTVQPQRILLKDVAGELPASAPNGPTFSGFSAINTATFDSRFSPSFHIMCYAKSFLILFKDTFQDLGWVEEVIIQDCDILSLPTQSFSHFGEVNSFIIQGGSIANMVPDSFTGLDVKKMTTALSPKGEFIIRNSEIVAGQLPFGALYAITNVATVVLDNNHITTLSSDTFNALPKLSNLSISYNGITRLPAALLAKTYSLGHLSLWGVPWECDCSSLWFIPYAKNNNVTLSGDIICSSPYVYINKRATSFYKTNCMSSDPCNGGSGIASGNKCISILEVLSYVFFVLLTIATIIAFGLVMNLYLHIKGIQERRAGFLLRRSSEGDKLKMQNLDMRKNRPIKPRDPSFD